MEHMSNIGELPVREAWELLPGDILPCGDVRPGYASDLMVIVFAVQYGEDTIHICGRNLMAGEDVDFLSPADGAFYAWERV